MSVAVPVLATATAATAAAATEQLGDLGEQLGLALRDHLHGLLETVEPVARRGRRYPPPPAAGTPVVTGHPEGRGAQRERQLSLDRSPG